MKTNKLEFMKKVLGILLLAVVLMTSCQVKTSNKGNADKIVDGVEYYQDDIGEVFGRARPASGFDCDLKTLAKLTHKSFQRKAGIIAPLDDDVQLSSFIEELRQQGETVVTNISNESITADVVAELGCDRQISFEDGSWVVKTIK